MEEPRRSGWQAADTESLVTGEGDLLHGLKFPRLWKGLGKKQGCQP